MDAILLHHCRRNLGDRLVAEERQQVHVKVKRLLRDIFGVALTLRDDAVFARERLGRLAESRAA